MMNWNCVEQEGSVRVAAELEKGEDLDCAMESLWHAFILNVVPLHKSVIWDYIKIEFWEDSGCLLVFPANSKVEGRVDKAMCDLTINDLKETYESFLNKSGDWDEDALELEFKKVAQCAIRAFKRVQALRRLRRKEIEISIHMASDEEPLVQKVLKI